MVRHEAAEALGGVPSDGSDGGAVLQLLREWAGKRDAPDVVRDSCVVAVDMWEVRIYLWRMLLRRNLMHAAEFSTKTRTNFNMLMAS